MLEKVCAYIVSEKRDNGNFLFEICDAIDIGQSRQYAGLRPAEKQSQTTPICFFLFPASEGDDFLVEKVREIRTSQEHNICFAPIILMTPDLSPSKITLGLSLGFDEILTPPWSPHMIRARFMRQVTNAFDYFSTETYFGPDRRRLEAQHVDYYADDRRNQNYKFRRYSIRRNCVAGVEILTDETFEMVQGVKMQISVGGQSPKHL